ncbi:MAG: penicillin-binding protein [Bacteroidales bacterium]|nr:penicillin-binding protein [Bacteroidales bacterium]
MAQYKTKQKGKKGKGDNSRRGVAVVWMLFVLFWLAVAGYFTMLSQGWLGFMPSFEELENPRSNQASEVWSADGELLGYIGIENRSNMTFDEITDGGKNMNLVNALVATEDVRFYDHAGIDARSLVRVLVKTLVGRHSSSGGGSTITQQLAKNLFPREHKSKVGLVHAKFKEWVVAVKLEHNYSKEEILAMYLNTVDFGSNAYGIQTAARTFFDKEPQELSVPEAAVLVGLLKAPTTYSPYLHPDNSLKRRNVVMSQMNNYTDPNTGEKYLSDEDFEAYKELPIDMSHYSPISHNEGLAPYLRELVRQDMKEWCASHKKPNGEYYDVHKDGLRIYTTIDSRMQRHAEAAVRKHMSELVQPKFFQEVSRRGGDPFNNISKEQEERFLKQAMKASDRYYQMKQNGMSESEITQAFKEEKVKMRIFSWDGPIDTVMTPWDSLLYNKKFINVGMMSVEPGTGYVKAYVGGINFRYFKFDNVKQTRRQVGSTFKPFVYATALQELDYDPYTQVPNTEVCIGTWCPRNSSHQREGEMVTLKWALANSINWVSARLMQQIGDPQLVINTARKMGVKSPIDPVPSISVGAAEISVYEMAGAMATFANQGEYVTPIYILRIEDNNGNLLESFTPDHSEAISPRIAWMMIDMMKGVVDGGTGARLRGSQFRLTAPIAGKTGTTQNNSDCWFVGITPKLATVVWTGGEVRSIHFRSMDVGQGARQAMPIFGYYMRSIYDDSKLNFPTGDFTKPSDEDLYYDYDEYQYYQQEVQSEESDPFTTTNW